MLEMPFVGLGLMDTPMTTPLLGAARTGRAAS